MTPHPRRREAAWARASPGDRATAAQIADCAGREKPCGFCAGVALGVVIGAIDLALVLEWLIS